MRGFAGCLLVGLAGFTILPGCAQLPSFGDSALPRRFRNDGTPFSTAGTFQEVQAKSPERPPPRMGIVTVEDVLRPASRAKRMPELEVLPVGDVKVEVEPAPPPAPLIQPAPPTPLTLPRAIEQKSDKTDHSAAVRALQLMLDERHPEAIQQLRAYDDATQEFLLRLLPPLTMFLKRPIADMSPQEVANLIEQLDRLRDSVRARSELAIGKMCFCREVMNFGNIKALADGHAFVSASKDRPGEYVQLYVELRNFASEPSKEGEYLTRLACALDLKNAKGESVWSRTIDRSQTTLKRCTRLNDLYTTYCFYVPILPAGKYQLTVQIADETTDAEHPRVARKTLDFHVTPVVNQVSR